ncbi:GntR family transcriptional regulator [Streptomyces regensis]|uniref:DNA-binding GntR family transcriptional regulator n=1 Tax=Prauserella rugosa TaxID=43354 RepID=A0A660CEY4_9PSEU|nr:transcriptional regulator [Prauserella sp. Am3]KMS91057.1 GntR family transcriptional regulator [Streptomyces regensis]TWH20437.1 DNA-binding GntR family transcriptional regulator [Prauserella rugosa]
MGKGSAIVSQNDRVDGSSSKGALAYRELRRRIISGELEPGSRLSQYELADELRMSITPLREGIRQLASEEWLHMDTYRDVRVAPVDAEEARELLEVRLLLEPTATELAAQRRTDAEVSAMKAAAEALLPVTRTWGEEAIRAHREFHRAIYRASHNHVLIRMLDGLWDKADRYRHVGLQLPVGDEPRGLDLEQHHQILDLVINGEGRGAAELVRTHIHNSLGASVTETLDNPPGATRD